jgi:Lactoylglutathione lyase and related lyases
MLTTFPVNVFVRITDPERARRFYEQVLGLAFEYDNEYVMVFRSGATQVIVQKVQEFAPIAPTVLGWEVKGIRNVVASLQSRGVTFVRYPGMEQDADGIWTSPAGRVAWFKDPDGNVLSVSEHP